VTSPTRSNAKAWAKKFEARLLEPGIVSYEDSGCGKAYLTRQSIERSAQSFIGRPLILTPQLKHKRVTPAQLEKEARGYVTDVYFNSDDGWFWCKGICHDDEAKEAINRVGFCSCAYEVLKVGTGGEYHAIPYDEEILEFSGEHLAIVDKPRYEGATIRLNSKPKTNTTMFKWIRKLASRQNATEAPEAPAASVSTTQTPPAQPPVAAIKENAVPAPAPVAEEITGETELEIPTRENGKTEKVTLTTLVEVYNARNDPAGAEDALEVDGKPVKISDLIAGFKANAKPEGETDEDKTKREKAEADEKAKKEKENAKPGPVSHFKVLLNARQFGSISEGPTTGPDDIMARVARGNDRYGSKKAASN
jgi:hypothetical protein